MPPPRLFLPTETIKSHPCPTPASTQSQHQGTPGLPIHHVMNFRRKECACKLPEIRFSRSVLSTHGSGIARLQRALRVGRLPACGPIVNCRVLITRRPALAVLSTLPRGPICNCANSKAKCESDICMGRDRVPWTVLTGVFRQHAPHLSNVRVTDRWTLDPGQTQTSKCRRRKDWDERRSLAFYKSRQITSYETIRDVDHPRQKRKLPAIPSWLIWR